MQISKITFQNNSQNNYKTTPTTKEKNVIKNTAYTLGGAALGATGFLTVDSFGERKDYKQGLIMLDNQFVQDVHKLLNEGIENAKQNGKELNNTEIKILKAHIYKNLLPTYTQTIQELKTYRTNYLMKWGALYTGIGAAVGLSTAFATKYLKNKKSNHTPKQPKPLPQEQYSNFNTHIYQQNRKNMINFTGVIEEYAEDFSIEDLENAHKYIKGDHPTRKEELQARRIAAYTLQDWPKGLIKRKISWLYQDDKYRPYIGYYKPKTDKEYQYMIIDQDFKVPPKPPKYYRLYDKLFKTNRYNAVMNDTDKYFYAALKNERMKSIVNKYRLEEYQKRKTLYDMQSKRQLSLACIKSKINKDFLIDFNSNDKNIKIPNAILIESTDKIEREKSIKWIIAKANSHYVNIQDNNDNNSIRINQIYTVLEEAKENFEKSGKRTLLEIQNFDKMLENKPENEEIIGDLKDLLCKLSSEYHTTILFDAPTTIHMDPIALQGHRVKKYNIDKEIPIEELKKFQEEFVKSNIHKMDNSDGYKYKYIPFKEDFIDLYLGNFGYSKDILWINSSDSEKIIAVLNNLKAVKTVDKFKDINKIRFPLPDDIEKLNSFNITNTGNKTLENKSIYEIRPQSEN